MEITPQERNEMYLTHVPHCEFIKTELSGSSEKWLWEKTEKKILFLLDCT